MRKSPDYDPSCAAEQPFHERPKIPCRTAAHGAPAQEIPAQRGAAKHSPVHDKSVGATTGEIADFYPLPGGEQQYSTEFIETQRALFLGTTRQDSENIAWIAVSGRCREKTRSFLSNYHRWRENSRVMFLHCSDIDVEIHLTRLSGGKGSRADAQLHARTGPLSQGPGQRMLRSILLEAVKRGATDIHFEPGSQEPCTNGHAMGTDDSGEARIRVNVHGDLQVMRKISPQMCSILVNSLRVLAALEIFSHGAPQDGSFTLKIGLRNVRMRLSVLSTMQGPSASIRILNPGKDFPSPEQLGFSERTLRFFRYSLSSSHGLILFSGPTGCGKTTSMYALAGEAVKLGRKVISIEEPVEIILPGVEQIEANSLAGLDYPAFLPAALRRKPDVLIIGEIRDRTTAELALDAGLSGHLVLSTIHAPSAETASHRLKSLGIRDRFRLQVLKAVVGQRLMHHQDGTIVLEENLHIPPSCSSGVIQPGEELCTVQ